MKTVIALFLFLPLMASSQQLEVDDSKAVITYDLETEVDEGTISGLKTDIQLNLDDLDNSSIKATVDVSTLLTNNESRDEDIRNEAEHFDGQNHPLISYTSNKIVKTASGYMAYGTLKIKDIERDVKLPFIYKDDQLIGRMKIHTGHFNVFGEAPEGDDDAFNSVIRIKIPVK